MGYVQSSLIQERCCKLTARFDSTTKLGEGFEPPLGRLRALPSEPKDVLNGFNASEHPNQPPVEHLWREADLGNLREVRLSRKRIKKPP